MIDIKITGATEDEANQKRSEYFKKYPSEKHGTSIRVAKYVPSQELWICYGWMGDRT